MNSLLKCVCQIVILWTLMGLFDTVQAQYRRTVLTPRVRLQLESLQNSTDQDCFFNRLTIIRRQTGQLLQTITFDQETQSSLSCRSVSEILLKPMDVNADSQQDFFVISMQAATNMLYDLWLYQPARQQFKRVLRGISNPEVNRPSKEVISTHQNGVGSYDKDRYRYRQGTYYLYESKSRTYDELARLFRVVIKRRVNGRMQIVRQYTERQ